jgi:hypothetical protein
MNTSGYSTHMTTWRRERTRRSAARGHSISLLGAALVIWLLIGAVAAGQRHYYSGSRQTCAKTGTIAVTIIAGPLNYVGANPKVGCHFPQPSR